MSISVSCAQCGRNFEVGDEQAGLRTKCNHCGATITISHRGTDGLPRDFEDDLLPASIFGDQTAVSDNMARPTLPPTRQRLRRHIALAAVILLGGTTVVAVCLVLWNWGDTSKQQPAPDSNAQTDNIVPTRTGDNLPGDKQTPVKRATLPARIAKQRANSDANSLAIGSNPAFRPPQQFEPIPRAVATAYRKGTEFVSAEHLELESLNKILQPIASQLPVLKVSVEQEELKWNTVTLNRSGLHLDAFRFKCPLDGPTEMHWAFVTDGPKGRWHILPAEGTMQGFYQWNSINHIDAVGIDLPLFNECIYQLLPSGRILPGREYIVWFYTEINKPLKRSIAIRLSSARDVALSHRFRDVADRMGLKYWRTPHSPGCVVLGGHEREVLTVRFTPDGRHLISGGFDGVVKFWDLQSRSLVFQTEKASQGVRDLDVSSDGKYLAFSYSGLPAVSLWSLADRRFKATLQAEGGWISGLCFSPDGKRLAARYNSRNDSLTNHVTMWDVETEKRVSQIPFDGRGIDEFVFTRDGSKLMTFTSIATRNSKSVTFDDSKLGVYDVASGNEIAVVSMPPDRTFCAAVSPAGNQMLVTLSNKGLKVWDLDKLKVVRTEPSPQWMRCVRFSTDGRHVVIGRHDGTIHLRNTKDFRIEANWQGHQGYVTTAAFSPDGSHVASGCQDGRIRIWPVKNQELHSPKGLVTNSVGMKLVKISAGKFQMGLRGHDKSTKGYDEKLKSETPLHRVRITKSFYLGQHEVTVGQFRQFVEATGYTTIAETNGKGGAHIFVVKHGYEKRPELNWMNPGFEQSDNHPVVDVSYHDAAAYCDWLSKKENRTYRLPTEAEWEYACRSGTRTRWSFGNYSRDLLSGGNVADASIRAAYKQKKYPSAAYWSDDYPFTAEVGISLPNISGLFDMHGNVFEWCSDWYDPSYYSYSPRDDPSGPQTGKNRVQRGGAFSHNSNSSRSASRDFGPPDQTQSCLGFRVVMETP